MRKLLFILIPFAFISCNKEVKKPEIKKTAENIELHKDLYGFWVGDFIATEHENNPDNYVYSNKINIVIKKIFGNKVYGQSIVAGNVSPFEGEMKNENNVLNFILNESGDVKNNGKFSFTIKQDTLAGEWIPNNSKAVVTKRSFKLVKQKFEYDAKLMLPEEGDYVDYYSMKLDTITEEIDNEEETYYNEMYRTASEVILTMNASTTKLAEEDVKNLKKLELEILRNTIFARHGYTFKKKAYRQFFDPVAWYVPVSNDVTADLTTIEKGNIALLERFEKYAEDNYDTFGR